VCLTLPVLFAWFLGCSSSDTDKIISAQDITGLGAVEIKALDAADNPYETKYEDWDHWAYRNIVTGPLAYENGKKPDDLKIVKIRVTSDGYMLPATEKTRVMSEHARQGFNDAFDIKHIAPFAVQAAGTMPDEMKERMRLAVHGMKSTFYLPVPDWLAAEPPIWAMLVPNGDVITYGPLGSGHAEHEGEGCCGGSGESYYRYSTSGELLRTSPVFWWDTYLDDIEYEYPEGSRKNRLDGYFYFTDTEADEILSVWDWDGTQLELPILPPMRDVHPFMSHTPTQIKGLFDGQHAQLSAQGY
jgi:hypothetical protein